MLDTETSEAAVRRATESSQAGSVCRVFDLGFGVLAEVSGFRDPVRRCNMLGFRLSLEFGHLRVGIGAC